MASFFLDALVITAEHEHVTNPQYVAAIFTLVFALVSVYLVPCMPPCDRDCSPWAPYIIFQIAYASLVVDDFRNDRPLSVHAYNCAIADIVIAVIIIIGASIFGCMFGCFVVLKRVKEFRQWMVEFCACKWIDPTPPEPKQLETIKSETKSESESVSVV